MFLFCTLIVSHDLAHAIHCVSFVCGGLRCEGCTFWAEGVWGL